MTVKEIFSGIQQRLDERPDKIRGLDAVFQFELGGEEAGAWHVVTSGGKATVAEGAHASPGVTIVMDSGDFKDMIAGKLNSVQAFMSGKLKVKGDMGLAMKLQNVLQ